MMVASPAGRHISPRIQACSGLSPKRSLQLFLVAIRLRHLQTLCFLCPVQEDVKLFMEYFIGISLMSSEEMSPGVPFTGKDNASS